MTKKLNDEQRAEQRIKVAQELATKDGADFESLDEIMKSAYLHNADCAIADREAKPPAAAEPRPVPTCSVCNGEGFVSGQPCRECNPVGLQREETKQEEPAPVPAPEPAPKIHKHHYRKNGTCVCGAVLSAKRMKIRERKAKG